MGFTLENRAGNSKSGGHARHANARLFGAGCVFAVLAFVCSAVIAKEDSFKSQLGAVTVAPVAAGAAWRMPYITWGGDIATFHANGGLKTVGESLFDRQGLKIELTPGDDFQQQVKDYLAGKSPFLRGTLSMIGLASEAIGEDPRTRGVVFLQMTWSAGDHLVVRNTIKTANDLKGKTILLQRGGPHIGMLNDVLIAAKISWDDINVVWAKDLTGTPNSSAEMFRKDPKYDACFVISPDMASLTGGAGKTGSGADGTVKDARVLLSTKDLSRSITDVYVCRKDFYDANKEQLTRFVSAYLKACEQVLEMKKMYTQKDPTGSSVYKKLMSLAQDIYTKEVVPSFADADGMIDDLVFTLHPGNKEFFTDPNSLTGFGKLSGEALDLAVNRGYAGKRYELLSSGLDYDSALLKGELKIIAAHKAEIDKSKLDKAFKDMDTGALPDGTIMSFFISFDADQDTFPAERYKDDFTRVATTIAKFGNAVIVVRGHTDPALLLKSVFDAGTQKKVLERLGAPGAYTYTLNGKPFNFEKPAEVVEAIKSGAFDGATAENGSPKDILSATESLSQRRAEKVRDTIVEFAKTSNWALDPKQITFTGVGVREPVVARPRGADDSAKNRRVEFRLMKIPAEVKRKEDYDY